MATTINVRLTIFAKIYKNFTLSEDNYEISNIEPLRLLELLSEQLNVKIEDIIFCSAQIEKNGKFVNLYDLNKVNIENNSNIYIVSEDDINIIENNIIAWSTIDDSYLLLLKYIEDVKQIIKNTKEKILFNTFDYADFVDKYPSGGYIYWLYNDLELISYVRNIQNVDIMNSLLDDIYNTDDELAKTLVKDIVNESELILVDRLINESGVFDEFVNPKSNKAIINFLIGTDIHNYDLIKKILYILIENERVYDLISLAHSITNVKYLEKIAEKIENNEHFDEVVYFIDKQIEQLKRKNTIIL